MLENTSSSRGSRGNRETTTPEGNTSVRTEVQRKERKLRIQLVLAVVLAVFGMLLFVVSFVVPPTGIIDSSVLVAAGEAFTFSGALIGVDYSYKARAIHD